MKITELQAFYNNIRKGSFFKASWQSVKIIDGDEYKKVSQGVVRIVRYANIKGVQVKGNGNPSENCLIPNFLYHNANTGSDLVQLATTKVKAKCVYFINGVEVSKQDFEKRNPSRKGNPSPVFRVKAENILSLGE